MRACFRARVQVYACVNVYVCSNLYSGMYHYSSTWGYIMSISINYLNPGTLEYTIRLILFIYYYYHYLKIIYKRKLKCYFCGAAVRN